MKKIISIAMAIFSGLCVLVAFYSEKHAVDYIAPAVLVGFLTYLQFSLSHDAFKLKGLAQWLSGAGAVVLFVMAVAGNTVYWLSRSNTDSARLATLERNLKLADADKVTAIALLNNCNPVVVKGCIKPRSDDLKAKEAVFNNALIAYNAMLSSISKQESFKIASSVVGEINQKQFLFLRALIGSFFLELGIVYFYVLSCSNPLDKPVTAVESFKKKVYDITNRNDLTDDDKAVFTAWEQFDADGKTLKNNMPGVMSHFTVAAFGKQGGQWAEKAEESLRKLEIVK